MGLPKKEEPNVNSMREAKMPRFQITFHDDGWLQFNIRKLRPDFSQGQIHRWRLRLGPIELRGWRNFHAPAIS